MFAVVRTLLAGGNARTEAAIRDHFAVDLLEQKIREAEAALSASKETLAAIILRERNEGRALERLDASISDLESRTRSALEKGSEDLARDGAAAIAELEDERTARRETVKRLSEKAARLRLSVEKAHRRIADLKQGLIQAQAIDAEARTQRKLDRSIGGGDPMREAQSLLDSILERDDPFEEGRVLDEIDAALDGDAVRNRMAQEGHGRKLKTDADDVLRRLKDSD